MTGAAMQVVTKSAANKVIRLGRYLKSRSVQGKTTKGTVGVKAKIAGSQIRKTPSLIIVVKMISNRKDRAYPTVKEV